MATLWKPASGWSPALSIECWDPDREQWDPLPLEQEVVLRLGGEGHGALLSPCEQWQALQELSRQTRRALAYLVTPGVFIKKVDGRSLCRAWPWEWRLAAPHPAHFLTGPLVSVATGKPVPISGRLRVDSLQEPPTSSASVCRPARQHLLPGAASPSCPRRAGAGRWPAQRLPPLAASGL